MIYHMAGRLPTPLQHLLDIYTTPHVCSQTIGAPLALCCKMCRSVTQVTDRHKCSRAHNKLFSDHSEPRKIQIKLQLGPLSLSRHDPAVFPWFSHRNQVAESLQYICHKTCITFAKTVQNTRSKVPQNSQALLNRTLPLSRGYRTWKYVIESLLYICHKTYRTHAKLVLFIPNKVRRGPLPLSRHDPVVFPWLKHSEVCCRFAFVTYVIKHINFTTYTIQPQYTILSNEIPFVLIDLSCAKSRIFMVFMVLTPSPTYVILCNEINDSHSGHMNFNH